jgi:hypothetical protein
MEIIYVAFPRMPENIKRVNIFLFLELFLFSNKFKMFSWFSGKKKESKQPVFEPEEEVSNRGQ